MPSSSLIVVEAITINNTPNVLGAAPGRRWSHDLRPDKRAHQMTPFFYCTLCSESMSHAPPGRSRAAPEVAEPARAPAAARATLS